MIELILIKSISLLTNFLDKRCARLDTGLIDGSSYDNLRFSLRKVFNSLIKEIIDLLFINYFRQ